MESLPEGQKDENLCTSGKPFNKNHGYRITSFEVSPDHNYFCNQHLPYHKTQYENVLVRYQGGFITHISFAEHQNIFDDPIHWQKNEVFKSESPRFAVDVRSQKNKTNK